MTEAIQLDPDREGRVAERLTQHFTRLTYPNVAQAALWSLSIEGAALRFRYLLPFLQRRLDGSGEIATADSSGNAEAEGGARDRLRLLVSGMGSGSEMIAARNLGFGEVHGTEVDAFYVTLVAERLAGLPGFFPLPIDGMRTPYADRVFDVVVSGHIVEHTADPAAYVAEHLRVLKPGGYFLIEFPNRFHTRELHTGLPSLEWLPDRLRTALLLSIGSRRGLGAFGFSEATRKRCRAITDTGLKQVSLGRVRRWARASGVRTTLLARGRPGPGVVYGLFRRAL